MPHLSIFSFKEIRSFVLLLLLFFISFTAFFELNLCYLGETVDLGKYILVQEKEKTLYGPYFMDLTLSKKISGAVAVQPEIIAMGTSRGMLWRQEHFSDGLRFYNGSVGASISKGLRGMLQMLEALEKNPPKMVILNLDPWLFNPGYPENAKVLKQGIIDRVNESPLLRKLYVMYHFIKRRYYAYTAFLSRNKNFLPLYFNSQAYRGMGVSARLSNSGFRYDGSFIYPKNYQTRVRSFDEWQHFLENERYRWGPAKALLPNSVGILKELLTFCKKQGSEVLVILPPIRNDFFETLMFRNDRKEFFDNYRREICEITNEFGYECLDIVDPIRLNLKEEDFLDYTHMKQYVVDRIADMVGFSK